MFERFERLGSCVVIAWNDLDAIPVDDFEHSSCCPRREYSICGHRLASVLLVVLHVEVIDLWHRTSVGC